MMFHECIRYLHACTKEAIDCRRERRRAQRRGVRSGALPSSGSKRVGRSDQRVGAPREAPTQSVGPAASPSSGGERRRTQNVNVSQDV